MVNYKKTGKYVQTPEQNPTDVYVGIPEQVDYSGKSTRIDDNFTYIASHIGDGQGYLAGTGLVLTDNIFSLDNSTVNALIATAIAGKQNTLTAGDNIAIDENNVISVYGISQYNVATEDTNGLMSADDKYKLDNIAVEANNYVLPIATSEVLGGIKVGDNLTIDPATGVLDATNTTYTAATPSVGGVGGSIGLLTPTDKEKLDNIQSGATYVNVDPRDNADGTIQIGNNFLTVYRHPAYSEVTLNTQTGKVVKGISVDDLGHVTGVTLVNEAGITVSSSGIAGVVTSITYDDMTRTLDVVKEYVGTKVIGILDSSTTTTEIAAIDPINTVVKKILNRITQVNTTLSADIAKRLQYKGTTAIIPNNAVNGDVYKVSGSFIVSGNSVVTGDLIIYNNSSWVVIPSGEKADTWRPIYVENNPVLTSEFNSGYVNFKGTGNTSLIWDNATHTINIQTLGSTSGTGNVVYIAGDGIGQVETSTEDPETHEVTYRRTFNLDKATDQAIGGIIVGSGLTIDGSGVLSATATTYTASHGLQVVNDSDIRPVYGNSANTIAEGNHSHTIGSLDNVEFGTIYQGDVLTYSNGSWTNVQPTNTYAAGTNVAIRTSGGVNYIDATDTNTWRTISVNGASIGSGTSFNIAGGTGINLNTSQEGDVYTVTIVNTGGGGGGGGGSSTTYTAAAPINISNTDVIGLNIDSNKLELIGTGSNAQLSVKTISYSDLSNKPDIPVIKITGNQSANTVNFVAGSNITLTPSTSSGTTTVTIDCTASGGGGGGTTYTAGNGINISGTTIAIKRKVDASNALHIDENDGSLYATDTNTTYNVVANSGLALSGTDFSVVRDTVASANALTIGANGLLVKYDDNTIKSGANGLYVAATSTIVPINTAAVTISSMSNNTIYQCSTPLTSLTVSALDPGFSYATISFTTSSSGCTFTKGASAWRAVGYDCAGGSFSPVGGKEYQIAVDNLNSQVTFYVLRLN